MEPKIREPCINELIGPARKATDFIIEGFQQTMQLLANV